MTFAQKMFSFQGRMRRRDFWICTLILWGISLASLILLMVFGWDSFMALAEQSEALEQSEDPMEAMRLVSPLLPLIGIFLLIQLATVWPSLAVCVKRLHDRNQNGLWVMLLVAGNVLSIIPVIGGLISLGVSIWWLVNLGILDGTPGVNQYGPSPKGLGHEEVFA